MSARSQWCVIRVQLDVFICMLFVCSHVFSSALQCVGPSMLPTFNTRGDVALVEHASVAFRRLHVGDVVVARSVQNPRHIVCKRILGLEGDLVQVAPGLFSRRKLIEVVI